jgi:hypothetical protein
MLDEKGWTGEVGKMIGASIKPTETRIIVDYLVTNYGAGAKVRSTLGR